MASYTTNYKLEKPELEENYAVAVANANMEKIDKAIYEASGVGSGVLNTANTSSLSTSSSEKFVGTINLHKISKTGSYNDLLNKPTISSPSETTPLAPGAATTGTETAYARGDHVHPLQTTITGNAATATKLKTAVTIQTDLGSTSAASFDGSSNITPGIKGTLAIAHGGTGATTAANAIKNLGGLPLTGGTLTGELTVPSLSIGAEKNVAFRVQGTDNGVLVMLSGGQNAVVLDYTEAKTLRPSNTAQGAIDLGSTTNKWNHVYANTFYGSLSGNASTATKLATARKINGVAFDGSKDITITSSDSSKVPLAGGTMTGMLNVPQITITNTEMVGHLIFSRDNANYIQTKTAGGKLAFVTNGKTCDGANSDMIISGADNAVYPGTTNVTTLGKSGQIWKAVYATTFNGNATSATKLATGRTIQTDLASTSAPTFDGSGNIKPGITGTLAIGHGGTGATTAANAIKNLGGLPLAGGTMTGTIASTITTTTHIKGNQGTAIINSTAASGYNMLARMKSKNGVWTFGSWDEKFCFFYTSDTKIAAGTNGIDKQLTLLNESGNTTFPGTVTASSFSGNASSASKLSTARTLTFKGAATGSVSFDGSANKDVTLTLSTSGVTAGSYGPSANASPGAGKTFSVPYITVNDKGLVTGCSTKTITLPADANTDTKVTSNLATTTKSYVVGTASATTSTGTLNFDTGVYLDTTAGQLVATTFKGALSGNASTATKLATARKINGVAFDGSKDITVSLDTSALQSLVKDYVATELSTKYPVGSILMNTSGTNPKDYLGFGTWVLFGSGRTPVCINTNDTDFKTVEKTGGAKTHTHSIPAHNHGGTSGSTTLTIEQLPKHTHLVTGSTIGAGLHTHALQCTYIGASHGHYYDPGNAVSNGSNGGTTFTDSGERCVSNGSHTHSINFASQSTGGGTGHTHSVSQQAQATSGSSSSLMPYIVCYIWKRTA